jgi:hypothetical protein
MLSMTFVKEIALIQSKSSAINRHPTKNKKGTHENVSLFLFLILGNHASPMINWASSSPMRS